MALSVQQPDCSPAPSPVVPPSPGRAGWHILRGASGDIGPGQETEERWYWDAKAAAWRIHPADPEAYLPNQLACSAYLYVGEVQQDR